MGGGGKSGGDITIGYRYFMGLHMAICHGPVDAVGPIIAGERVAYDGRVTDTGEIEIDKPDLFGGEKKEGGIKGFVDILFGKRDQGQNSYLLGLPGFNTGNLPAFRGVLSIIAKKIYIAAMSPYPKPWWIGVSRYPGIDWLPELAKINTSTTDSSIASANAAHMIRECLLNNDWGLGYSADMIDLVSFSAAAQTLFNEGFGLSMILTEQTKVEDFIQTILQHVNGAMYPDRETGKFSLSLIRDDYVVGDLPVYNEDNIIELNSFQRPLLSDLVNEVVIKFRRRGAIQDTAFTFQNLALIQIQGSVISQTVNYPGIDNDGIATRVGQRELQQQSSDLLQIQITVNRVAWNLEPGAAFVFQWEEYGIDQIVMRVSKIDYGTLQNGRIVIDAVQDVFALPDTSYLVPQDSLWEDNVVAPQPVTVDRVDEVPYFEIAAGVFDPGAEDTLDSGDTFIQYSADEPIGTVGPGFQLWANPTDSGNDPDYIFRNSSVYTPNVTLGADISFTAENGITVNGLGFNQDEVQTGTYAFLDNEVVRIDAIDPIAGTVDIGRGCLDTVPAEHASGSILWFVQGNAAIDFTVYQAGGPLAFKALSQTGTGILPIADADERLIEPVARQYLPYPAANVRFSASNLHYPETVAGNLATRVQWSGRNRLTQTVPSAITDFFDAHITPEADTIYDVEFFSEVDLEKDTASRVYAGLSLTTADGTQDWLTEDADSNVGVYAPPSGYDLYMGLIDTSIDGSLSPDGVISNVVNVTQTQQGASFEGNGHFDFGDFALSATNFAISFEFIPEDIGDNDQFLIGKHFITGTTNIDRFTIGWRRANKALYYGFNTNTLNLVANSAGTVIPGRRNQILLVFVSGTGVAVYFNNRLLTTIGGISFPSWTGHDWTAGADYETASLLRRNFYRGILREVRFWDATTLTQSQVWPTTRVNSSFRVRIKTQRDGTDSMQDFDYTVPQRVGWGLQWDNNFNGGL